MQASRSGKAGGDTFTAEQVEQAATAVEEAPSEVPAVEPTDAMSEDIPVAMSDAAREV